MTWTGLCFPSRPASTTEWKAGSVYSSKAFASGIEPGLPVCESNTLMTELLGQ